MDQRDEILMYISHYEQELHELFNFLLILDNNIIVPQNEKAKQELESIKRHVRYLCFFISCFLDHLTTLKSLNDSETHWDRMFYLKNGMVSIYETVKTYNKHQKELRELINTHYKDFEPKFNAINLKLKEFKKGFEYDTTISKFRNKAGAHYDENFVEYYNSLRSIDNPNNLKAIWLFSNFLMALISLWGELIDLMHEESKNYSKSTDNLK